MQATNSERVTFSAGNLTEEINKTLATWQREHKVQALWDSDSRLWTNTDEAEWTGWLKPGVDTNDVTRISHLTQELQSAGCTDVVLLGMGGSSLCAAMMVTTFGYIAKYPRLHVLDSTAPEQILHLERQVDLQNTFFIVASKSGKTLESNILKDYFYTRLQNLLDHDTVGSRFIAITDPGTILETLAKTEHFKAIFYGIPSIGGRYSALSNFGMLPSALMGVDIKILLQHAESMAQCCSANVAVENNSGVVLGIILGVCANHGKNKITLVVSPQIRALGAWLEQLLAESTGKQGKGLIPVDKEPLGVLEMYGDDRVFVYIRLATAADVAQDRAIDVLEQAGHVVVRLNLQDKMHLGAECFRWEFATAVAGSVMGINPFNQPDVEASKVRARELTTDYEKTGKLSQLEPLASDEGIELFTDEKNAQALQLQHGDVASVKDYLQAHLARIEPGDYFALLAFIEMNAAHSQWLQKIRLLVHDKKQVATCLGFGPRFLHSTGQAYKGGPNTGVFLQITAEHENDISVPGHGYTLGFVINAQAQGDFEVLAERHRRVLRVHLGMNINAGLKRLYTLIAPMLTTNHC